MAQSLTKLHEWNPEAAPTEPNGPRRRIHLRGRIERGHVIMVVCGILAALLVAWVLRTNQDTVSVAVADRDIAPGASVTRDAVSWVSLPAHSVLTPTLAGAAEINASRPPVAATRIRQGDPIRRTDLGAALASNQRAMSIPVTVDHAAGGQLAEGDRVDVIAPAASGSVYVLRGAPVLSVPARARGPATLGDATAGNYFVVVGVGPDEALRLASAVREGKVEVLRSTGVADGVPPAAS